ncbi:hypothetical protein FHS14_003157 [Paenibacillus baekrokdamisoli]|uniref:DNA adenine methylase n=1 Tax=Paenibacillus baekrokdamisoli TaxID=1712516 RepID=UPI0017E4168A|nr:DNA adenine methylase [Paenibacillus baekrokdamisoli]MBB3070162.1 hypothetical protein [Paenibacillus baekrokdamisoli]
MSPGENKKSLDSQGFRSLSYGDLNRVRTCDPYPGGKWAIAKWIISHMPQHRVYLEPFFGSGAILFNKKPSGVETINDLNEEVINLFRIVREQTNSLIKSDGRHMREMNIDFHMSRLILILRERGALWFAAGKLFGLRQTPSLVGDADLRSATPSTSSNGMSCPNAWR